MGTAIRLLEPGIEVSFYSSLRAWRDATYPGAACDIPSRALQSTGDVPVVVSGQKAVGRVWMSPAPSMAPRFHRRWAVARGSGNRKVQTFSCRHELLLCPQSCRYTAPFAIRCPPKPNVQSSAFGTWPSGRCNHTSHARAAVLWVGLDPRCPCSPFTSYKGGCDGGVRTHLLSAAGFPIVGASGIVWRCGVAATSWPRGAGRRWRER